MEFKVTNSQVNVSKTISYALRHRPDSFGLVPDKNGWVDLTDLIKSVSTNTGINIEKSDIEKIIESSDKKRFEISGNKIRATYGHSFENKIQFDPSIPPKVLYHGTSNRAYEVIKKEGLKPMNRQYVHLSSDVKTARKVGLRHDSNPVILYVNSEQMHRDGFKFIHSGNDETWMCEKVPAKYITHSQNLN